MALLKFKRSAVSGKVPALGDLELGELAINTFDGKLYLRKDNGTASIIEVGAGAGSGVLSFNTRTGAVTLTSGDVTGALGFTPYNASNPAGYTSNTGTVTSVAGTGTVNGITLTGTVTSSGSLALGGTLSGVSLTTQVSGTLPVANGGTGATSLTSGYLVKGNGTSAASASVVYDDGTNVGVGTTTPGSKFTTAGVIESTSGGFKFPDATTQTTATRAVDIQEFTSSGSSTWTKPAGAKMVEIHAWAGGGGGGGGRSGAGSGNCGGGAGAMSGRYGTIRVLASDLGSAETVVVGAGGSGGGAGAPGSDGGTSSFGNILSLSGGKAGNAGSTAGGTAQADGISTANSPQNGFFVSRGLASAGATAEPVPPNRSGTAGGGGGGAGCTSASGNPGAAGGAGSSLGADAGQPTQVQGPLSTQFGGGGAAGTAGGAGGNGTARFFGGDGGGGGASVASGIAGKGGNGGAPAGGGGGGGASFNGTGGAGGNGAVGRVRVITYF